MDRYFVLLGMCDHKFWETSLLDTPKESCHNIKCGYAAVAALKSQKTRKKQTNKTKPSAVLNTQRLLQTNIFLLNE